MVTTSIAARSILFLLALHCLLVPQFAAAGGLKMRLRGGDFSGYTAVALSKNGDVLKTASVSSSNRASLRQVSGSFSVQLIDTENNYAGPAVAACSRAMQQAGCRLNSSKLAVGYSGRQNIGSMDFRKSGDGYFKSAVSDSRSLLRLKSNMITRARLGAPLGNANNLGRGTDPASLFNSGNPTDSNKDGVPDTYAVDDDGDNVIDNYDAADNNAAGASIAAVTAPEVRVFSNFKLNIEQSLNANTGTAPSTDEIDAALSSAGTLAIAVVGDAGAGDVTELDCGGLNYCSSGGTGRTVEGTVPFPDSADADADGLGEIAVGGTGDFQLSHGAASSSIGSGDTFFQVVTETSAKVTRVPGMLNFVFNATPALKTLSVEGGSSFAVTYPAAAGMQGSSNNCFPVPATGDLVLTFTAWRPQRPGNSGLAEVAFVDIGKARYVIDIPNLPCSGAGGCSGQGPGNCASAHYATTDVNLSAASPGEGLQDSKADADADSANTLEFTLNLTGCLGGTSFSSGEKLFLDLQAVSQYGDNAAQKFCIQRL